MRAARRGKGDEGFALVAVMGTMAVVTALLLSTLGFAISNMEPSREDQDVKTALAAAQAGIDEYISRLNVDDLYWRNGGVDATNPAFTAAGTSIPGTGGSGANFRYRILNTPTETAQQGIIRLESTGTLNGESRTLTAQLQPEGFLDFIYFTKVEATDPTLYQDAARATADGNRFAKARTGSGNYPLTNDGSDARYYILASPAMVAENCSKLWYEGRADVSYESSSSTSTTNTRFFLLQDAFNATAPLIKRLVNNVDIEGYCQEIRFATGDTLDGPSHTDDAMLIEGNPLFASPQTETAWADGASPSPPSGRRYRGSGTPLTSGPAVPPATGTRPGYRPVYEGVRRIPQSNADLISVADPASGPGCLYTGETRITFVGASMKVLSPGTRTNNRCYNGSTASLRNSEQTITPIPPVVYVNSVTTCGTARVGYPMGGESTLGATPDHLCNLGNAYVSGVVGGAVTVATSNDIIVTGDLTYQDLGVGTDVTGLIAGNYVWVYHPVKSDGSNLLTSTQAVKRIDAAILALRKSFLVQSWNYGNRVSVDAASRLNVRGAIAQKYRGPVGTSAPSGYLKNYVYDPRFQNLAPPYFLKPEGSPWKVGRLTE